MKIVLDNENREAVVPFHYGPVAGLVSLTAGTSGMAARQWRVEAEHRTPVLAGTTSTRIGAEAIRHGFYCDRARRRRLAKAPVWLCCLAEVARLRGLGLRR